MTDHAARASRDAARYRRQLRDVQQVVVEQQTLLLRICLEGRLADPSDFDEFIGRDQVIDAAGRILWDRVAQTVDELLARKPHLAAPSGEYPWGHGSTALEWITTEAR